jgi:glycosyltransferase involved in cell wall biosynthesis
MNALFLDPGNTGGMEFVVRMLIPALLEADPALRLTIFSSVEGAPILQALYSSNRYRVIASRVSGASRIQRSLVEQTLLPWRVGQAGVALLHNLAATAPAWCPVPQVTTIHDLNYRHVRAHTGLRRLGIAALVRVSVRVSTRLLTVSEFVAKDLAHQFSVPPERIDVAWHGPGIDPADTGPTKDMLSRRFGLTEAPIILCPASARPHKNVPRLIKAFAGLRCDAQLVLTGVATGFEDEVEREVRRNEVGPHVHRVGWVDDATMAGLYGLANLMVFPSLAEGFGLPLVEAMGRGVPVACSDRTSLPEIGGDAVAYFDPESTESIATVVDSLLVNPVRRAQLAAAGRRRAALFTWERAAQATLAAYRRALGISA